MKKINYLILILFSLFANQACQKESEIIISTETIAPRIITPESNKHFELEKTEFISISWEAVTFKEEKSSSQVYDVVLVPENSDKFAVLVGSTTNLNYNIESNSLNALLNSANFETDIPLSFELMIIAKFSEKSSAEDISSETLPIKLTIFDTTPEHDKWFVIGTAVGGWELSDNEELIYDPARNVYLLFLEMSEGKFKFHAPEKDEDPWKYNLGATGNTDPFPVETNEDLTIIPDGKDFEVSAGYYTLILDVANNKFSIKKEGENPVNAWYLMPCEVVGFGVSSENEKAEIDDLWNFGNKVTDELEQGILMETGMAYWMWTDILLEENKGFKLRAVDSESNVLIDAGYEDVLKNESTHLVDKDEDGNIVVSEKGHYDIKIVSNEDGVSFITIK